MQNVLDGNRSVVNDAQVHLLVKYDLIDDLLPELRPSCLQSKFDLADAFLHWPMQTRDSDCSGVQHSVSQAYYRFVVSWNSQSPAVQQAWATVIKELVNKHGLKYCNRASPETEYTRFRCTAAMLDDFYCMHDASLSLQQGAARLHGVSRFSTQDLGLEITASKTEGPAQSLCYTGLLIHSVAS